MHNFRIPIALEAFLPMLSTCSFQSSLSAMMIARRVYTFDKIISNCNGWAIFDSVAGKDMWKNEVGYAHVHEYVRGSGGWRWTKMFSLHWNDRFPFSKICSFWRVLSWISHFPDMRNKGIKKTISAFSNERVDRALQPQSRPPK